MKNKLLGLLAFCTLSVALASCTPSKRTVQEPEPEILPHRVRVLLKDRVQPKVLEQAFSAYKLKSEGPTSRSENRWLFTYDTATIKPDLLLEKLKASEWVLEAQLDTVIKEPKVNTGN